MKLINKLKMKNALKQITSISTASLSSIAFIIVSVNSGLTQTATTDNTDIQVIREYQKILMKQNPKIRMQSTQSANKNGGNKRYVQLAYCSSSSGQGDWINWGEQTPDRACQLVKNKFASWGQTITRSEFGYYKTNGENTVQVSCSRGFKFTKTGFNYEVFNNAVKIVRQQGVEGTCVYKVIN